MVAAAANGTMRRGRGNPRWGVVVVALYLALGVGARAQAATGASAAANPALTPGAPAAAATDPAYSAGYQAGYPLGQQDQSQGVVANAHKFQLYQDGSQGYTAAAGSPEAYRTAFQSGFADGYQDGYAGRPPSVALTAAAANTAPAAPNPGPAAAAASPAAPSASDTRIAIAYGYREGYSVGQSDADRQAPFAPQASQEYQLGSVGYHAGMGPAGQYQLNFRSGFETGYGDGYNHRLYNSQIGSRRLIETAVSAANPNPLPTSSERLAARPSGVYTNGLLVAEGTRIQATLDHAISTKTAAIGDPFTVTVTVPVWVGAVAAIPAGSTIQGTIEEARRGGLLGGTAKLLLRYDTLTLPGQTPIALHALTAGVGAAAVDGNEGTVNGQGAHTARKAVTGAAIGAVLGGIFGGGGGLLRGGVAGAAAGTAGSLITHQRDLVLRPGEPISLRLDRPLELPPSAN